MRPVYVAIPTIGLSVCLSPLVGLLRNEQRVTAIRLYDNGSTPTVAGLGDDTVAGVDVVEMPGRTIYEEWNDAITWAAGDGAYLALLNDDIELPPGAVDELAQALDDHPDYWLVCPDWQLGQATHRPPKTLVEVRGTPRKGGACGFGFMLRADQCPLVDESFEVWFGDDDLFHQISERGGKLGRIVGLGICHDGSTTLNSLGWVAAAIERDHQRWAASGRS